MRDHQKKGKEKHFSDRGRQTSLSQTKPKPKAAAGLLSLLAFSTIELVSSLGKRPVLSLQTMAAGLRFTTERSQFGGKMWVEAGAAKSRQTSDLPGSAKAGKEHSR